MRNDRLSAAPPTSAAWKRSPRPRQKVRLHLLEPKLVRKQASCPVRSSQRACLERIPVDVNVLSVGGQPSYLPPTLHVPVSTARLSFSANRERHLAESKLDDPFLQLCRFCRATVIGIGTESAENTVQELKFFLYNCMFLRVSPTRC